MRSFAPISLLVSAVCATFVAAAPAPPSIPPFGSLGGLGGLDRRAESDASSAGGSALGLLGIVLGDVQVIGHRDEERAPLVGFTASVRDLDAATLAAVSNAGSVVPSPTRRTETRSLPAILTGTCSDLHVVVDKITAIVAVKADIKIEAVVQLITDIKLILIGVVAEVKFLVDHPIDGLCEFNGKVFSVYEIAQLVAAIYTLVIACLASVIAVVGVEVKVIVSLIAEIDVILAEFLITLCFLVGGLLSALIPLIKCILGLIHSLHLEACLKVLGYP